MSNHLDHLKSERDVAKESVRRSVAALRKVLDDVERGLDAEESYVGRVGDYVADLDRSLAKVEVYDRALVLWAREMRDQHNK